MLSPAQFSRAQPGLCFAMSWGTAIAEPCRPPQAQPLHSSIVWLEELTVLRRPGQPWRHDGLPTFPPARPPQTRR